MILNRNHQFFNFTNDSFLTQSVLLILGDVPKSTLWSLTPSFWWFWTEIIDFYSKDDTFLLLNPYFSYLEMYQNQTDGRSHLGSDDCRQKSSTFYFTDLACNLIVWPSFLEILTYSISTSHTWRSTKIKLMVTLTYFLMVLKRKYKLFISQIILPYSISTSHTWRCTKIKRMTTHTYFSMIVDRNHQLFNLQTWRVILSFYQVP